MRTVWMARQQRNIMPRNAGLPDLPRAVVVGAGTHSGADVPGVLTPAKVVEALLKAERVR